MNKDFVTPTPEEAALIQRLNEKYPAMSFDLQAVGPARAGEVRRFMRAHLNDAEAQRAVLLSGGNWAGARLMNAALRDALIDWFIDDYERRGLKFPSMDRDANASFVDRRFEESHYETVHNQRDEARAELETLRALDAQRTRNTQYLLATVDDLKLDILMGRHNTQELIEKINGIVGALSSSAAPKGKPKAKAESEEPQGFGKLVPLTDEEILDKMERRQERQAERLADEARNQVEDTLTEMRPFVKDRTKARRLLDDVGQHADFQTMFACGIRPYLEAGDFVYPRRSSMQLAKLIHPYVQFRDTVSVNSLAKYLRDALDGYFREKKRQS